MHSIFSAGKFAKQLTHTHTHTHSSLSLCSFSELPECQLLIASQSDVVTQTVCMALSPSYPSPTKALASEVLLCLAHTPATHQFLATDFVISGILKTLTEEPNSADTTLNGLVGLRSEHLHNTSLPMVSCTL